MTIVNRPENLDSSCLTGASLEDTRQAEMLLVGLSLDDTAHHKNSELEKQSGKRRSLDDMRRLSEHIKAVPIYRGK